MKSGKRGQRVLNYSDLSLYTSVGYSLLAMALDKIFPNEPTLSRL